MKRSGPLYTLLAGLLLALVMLSLNATTGSGVSSYGDTPAAPSTPPGTAKPSATASTPAPSPTPTPSKTATPPPDASYAGRTKDDRASVAISLKDGKAIAYVCDGRAQEAWLKGDVKDDGTMKLSGSGGAKLEGTLRGNKVDGTVDLRKQNWQFTAAKAVKPSGLYRATTEVRGAKIDGGWIVLQNGRQVGIVDTDGKPAGAPPIDPQTGAVTVNGTEITAAPAVP
ncbi:hypothetical protein [Streptomyces sp. NBC_01465]|uniref:hypothetical protein n=1 Tax=Streptomyces sp. NBC_01465 TaxID=2903878 RepID=UPI002E31A88B|nr:hypothetical protein [Streptomyces sp. NBC_01465]